MSFLNKAILLTAAATATGIGVAAAVRKNRHIDLAGKVVIVTGGSRGLGLAICRELADAGARIATCARSADELVVVRGELEARGTEVLAEPCDVTSDEDVKRFISQVRERFGRIDVLVNNAGLIQVGPAEQMTMDDFDQVMDVNFRGPLRMMLEVMPDMIRRGSGRIVNIASVGGMVAIPHLASYCASKHALVGLSTALRGELAERGVLISTVCPGMIQTGSPRNARFKGDVSAEYEWFAAIDNTPGVAIDPADMAELIVTAIETGDAIVVAPWHTKLSAVAARAFSGAAVEASALVARLLPDATGPAADDVPGHMTGGDMPDFLERQQQEAAAQYNG